MMLFGGGMGGSVLERVAASPPDVRNTAINNSSNGKKRRIKN